MDAETEPICQSRIHGLIQKHRSLLGQLDCMLGAGVPEHQLAEASEIADAVYGEILDFQIRGSVLSVKAAYLLEVVDQEPLDPDQVRRLIISMM